MLCCAEEASAPHSAKRLPVVASPLCGLLSSVVRLDLLGTLWADQTVGRSLTEVSGDHPAQKGGKLMQGYSLGS